MRRKKDVEEIVLEGSDQGELDFGKIDDYDEDEL